MTEDSVRPSGRRRPRLADIAPIVLVVVALWLLMSQLGEVGFDTIWEQLRSADPLWLLAGLLAAQLMFVTQAVVLRGAATVHVPFAPAVALQAGLKVIGLTLPGSTSRVATDVRFLKSFGAEPGEAIVTATIEETSRGLARVALLLVVLPFVDLDLDLGGAGSVSSSTVIAVVVAVAAVAAVAAAVRPVREWLAAQGRRAWASLRTLVRRPSTAVRVVVGGLATEMVYALSLTCFAQAHGVELSLAAVIAVNTAGSLLASVIPAPGGIGSGEAALTGVLVAVGVDAGSAFAIALSQRLGTQYLPPLWGVACLHWLRRRNYL